MNVLSYIAILRHEAGTHNNPIATVMENTIGNVEWRRDATGEYAGISAGAFPENRTFCLVSQDAGEGQFAAGFGRLNNDAVRLFTYSQSGDLQDGWLMFVEIRVYP